MVHNIRFAALLICMLCSSFSFGQHYDLLYTCSNDSYSSQIDYLKPEPGYVSIDIDNEVIVFHYLNDSQIIEFKRPKLTGLFNNEWWLTLPRDAGDSWDGWILALDDKTKQPK